MPVSLTLIRISELTCCADTDTRPGTLKSLAEATQDFALLADEVGDKEDGLRSLTEGLAIWERLVRQDPQSSEYQQGLADAHFFRGTLMSATGRPAEAREALETARAIQERLARAHTNVASYAWGLARIHGNLGMLRFDTGDPAGARVAHEQARDIFERLVDGTEIIIGGRVLARSMPTGLLGTAYGSDGTGGYMRPNAPLATCAIRQFDLVRR